MQLYNIHYKITWVEEMMRKENLQEQEYLFYECGGR